LYKKSLKVMERTVISEKTLLYKTENARARDYFISFTVNHNTATLFIIMEREKVIIKGA
jgi:hypothetical protein